MTMSLRKGDNKKSALGYDSLQDSNRGLTKRTTAKNETQGSSAEKNGTKNITRKSSQVESPLKVTQNTGGSGNNESALRQDSGAKINNNTIREMPEEEDGN